jgi:hypothetical protein
MFKHNPMGASLDAFATADANIRIDQIDPVLRFDSIHRAGFGTRSALIAEADFINPWCRKSPVDG